MNAPMTVLASAQAHHKAGRLREAEILYRNVLDADPQCADAMHLLGDVFCQLGSMHYQKQDLDGAAAHFREALQIHPHHVSAWFYLGITKRDQEKPEEALHCFKQTVHLKPDFAAPYCDMGILYQTHGNVAEAVACYRKAIDLNPAHIDALNNLGVILFEKGLMDEAIHCYRQALAHAPGSFHVHVNLGRAMKHLGKKKAAEEHLRKAVSLQPQLVDAYYYLAEIKTFKIGDPVFNILHQIELKPSLSVQEKRVLHFTLGKLYDDNEAYEKAFHHFQTANENRAAVLNDTGVLDRIAALYGALKKTCDIDFFEKRSGYGIADDTPVFVVGMPRSGTTLVEQILAAHPSVHGAGELDELQRIEQEIFKSNRAGNHTEKLLSLDADEIKVFAARYLSHINAISNNATRVVDKMPQNFERLWLIALLFKNVKIIHCRRHPLDTCLSCYFNDFTRAHAYKNDLKTLGNAYRHYVSLVRHWRRVLPVPVLDISYEDLVDNQERVSRQIISFCGLDWHENCLSFHENDRPVQTASTLQVRQKMYRTSVGRWKNYRQFIQPLVEAIGDTAGGG